MQRSAASIWTAQPARASAFLLLATIALALLVWLVPLPFLRFVPGFLLLWCLPGLAWMVLLRPVSLAPVERVVIGLGLSFVITPILTLILAYLPGEVTRQQLLLALVAAVSLPWLLNFLWRRPAGGTVASEPGAAASGAPGQPWWRAPWIWLAAALLLALALRAINLGYAEFQGDEAIVMVRAARIQQGETEVLFQHKKGPAELLLALAGWSLTGIANEWMARLPFTLASLLLIVAVFLIGRRLERPHAAAVTAALLATEGFMIAFGRVVQYQSLVLALSALGLLCLLVYSLQGERVLLLLGAALMAAGFLAHYDAALALPAALFLVANRLWRERKRAGRDWLTLLLAGVLALCLVGLFYLPFLRSGYVANTSGYVANRLGGRITNNLWQTFALSTLYSSIYLLALLLLGLAARLWRLAAPWSLPARIALAAAGVAALSALLWPDFWLAGEVTLAWLPFALLFLGGFLAPDQKPEMRAIWLWLAAPGFFYLFLVESPYSHVYTLLPAWSLLAGLGLVDAGRWLERRGAAAARLAWIIPVMLFALGITYAVIAFVDHTPEYRRAWPESRNRLFWTPFQELPANGLYGFPYQAGWKVVGQLMAEGALAGDYASNEEPAVTDFYTRQAPRWPCPTPDSYITAVNVQDEQFIRWDQVAVDYRPALAVSVAGQPKLTVHQIGAAAVQVLDAADYTRSFDLGTTPASVASPRPIPTEVEPETFAPVAARFGDFVRLAGYHLDQASVQPGGYVTLTLLWEVLESAPTDYTVFNHLFDGDTMSGQLDSQPQCGRRPTSSWQPGERIMDTYRIPVRPDARPGAVPLLVGLYDGASQERLPLVDGNNTLAADAIYLTDVNIESGATTR